MMRSKKCMAILCAVLSLALAGCGSDTKPTDSVKQAETKTQDAEKTARDKMIAEITTGWNTETTDTDKDTSNWDKAIDLVKRYPDYIRQAEPYSPTPETMLKKPWEYYGKVVRLTGRVYSVEQRPPGDSVVKFFGQDCFHMMFVPSGGDVTFSVDIVGTDGNLRDDAIVTIRGYIYGHRGLVHTTFGGKSKGLGFVGFVDAPGASPAPAPSAGQAAPPPAPQQSTTIPAQSPQPPRRTAVPDLMLANVALGDSFDTVQQVLGTPYKQENKGNGKIYYYYPSVEVHCRNGTVTTLISETPAASTTRGLHEGSSLQDVLSAHGNDYMKSNYDGLDLYEYNFTTPSGRSAILRFAVNANGRVDYISIR